MKKKKFKAVSVDKLDEQTILQIREWRNQEFVRKTCLQQHEINLDEHLQFIDKIKADENRQLYVFYLDDEPFAVYQYKLNVEKNEVENSYYVISEYYQALGYGAIMNYAVNYINNCCMDVNYLYGAVLETNTYQLQLQKKENVPVLIEKVEVDTGKFVNVNYYRAKIEPLDDDSRLSKIVSRVVDIESVKIKEMYL